MKSRIPDDDVAASAQSDGSAAEHFRAAMRGLSELKEYAGYLVSAKVDGIRTSVRNAALYAVLGMLGGIAGAALVVSAVVLLCLGLSGAVAAIWDTWWAGHLIVGGGLLLLLGLGVWIALRKITSGAYRRTVEKYEQRKAQQRVDFGQDVHQRAQAQHH